MRVTYLCKRCTRAAVSREAWVEWDLRTQRWVIAQMFDSAWCHACQTETTLIEREVGPDPGPGTTQ